MPFTLGGGFLRKNIAILAILGLLFGPICADVTEARETASHAPPKRLAQQTSTAGQSTTDMSMQMPLVIPLFIENQDFSSTLVLTNAAAQTTYADVVLTRPDGREITQTRVQFPPHSQQSVTIQSLLAGVVSPATTGSITIMQAPDFPDTMVILGQLAITHLGSRETNYIDEEVAMPSAKSSQLLRAVADAGEGSPVVALTNLSMEQQGVSIQCLAEGGRSFSKSLALKGNETLLTDACSEEATRGASVESLLSGPSDSSAKNVQGPVGISLKSDGMPGTLAAFGLQRHKRANDIFYSAVTFVDPMMLKSPNTVFDGIAVGSADALGGGKYVPELSLTNFSAKKAHVQVTYAQMNGATPVTNQIADITLAAGTSKRLTFADLQGDPQLQNSLLITSDGEAGDVLAKLASHDAYTPERTVELLGKDAMDTNNGGSNPWSIEKGAESTLLLFNHDQEPQIFNVLIASADGTQWNKDFKLASMETRAISLSELVQKAVKDDKGKTLPKTAVSGQISWWTVGTASGPGAGRLLLSNQASNMARSFACGCPYILCGMIFDIIIDNLLLGTTITSVDELIPRICLYKSGCNGTTTSNSSSQALTYGFTSQSPAILQISGSSSNTTVNLYGASVGTGTMNGTISARYTQPSETCTFQGGGNNNVGPRVDSITPSIGVPGATVNVTISGAGFGSVPANVTVGTASGIAVTVTSVSDNSIGASFAIAPNVSAGSVPVQVQVKAADGSSQPSNTVNFTVVVFQGVLTPSDNFSGRSTTSFGLGEVINLSATLTPAGTTAATLGGLQWTIASGGGSMANAATDGTNTYTAPASSGSVTLRLSIASGSLAGQHQDYSITTISPSGAYMVKFTNVRHTMGYISVGFKGHVYLTPTNVSFAKLKWAEGTVNAVATGYFSNLNGAAHPPTPTPIQVGGCNINTGCIAADDTVDSNDDPPPFAAGDFLWAIPWQYQINSGPLITFTTANQHITSDATGTATIEKAGAGPFSKNASDPTTTY